MDKDNKKTGNREAKVIAVPYEDIKDPKSGKTISRKTSMVMAVGAAIAGIALNDQSSSEEITEIFLDTDGDNIADTLIADTNEDGVFEVIEQPTVEASSEEPISQAWNPHEAPIASTGTVNDEMSFSEAFSSAREELGAGGVFSWQGEYYNTFYTEELDENNQPTVEFQTTDQHDLPAIEYESNADEYSASEEIEIEVVTTEDDAASPHVMGLDSNADGVADAILVDLNQDGSADAMYVDLNEDGQLTEDEIVIIHDPAELTTPEVASDGSIMTADLDADGTDEVLLADVDDDQMADVIGVDENDDQVIDESEVTVLNPGALETEEPTTGEIEFDGEISEDMPEDVSEDVLESMDDDLADLEDNFDEINDWS